MKLLPYYTQHGIFFTCHNDVVFIDHLSRGKVFEEEIIFQHIFPLFQQIDPSIPKVILDIGGHIGSHSVVYAKYIPNVTVYTFEPQSTLFQILQMNIQYNQLTNVYAYHTAIGSHEGICTLEGTTRDLHNVEVNVTYDTDRLINYGGIGIGKGGETVPVCRIDSLHLSACHYMKIDVEGAESLVLLGALQTIRTYRPFILFEHTDKYVTDEMKESMNIPTDQMIEDSVSMLQKEGYVCIPIEGGNILALPEN